MEAVTAENGRDKQGGVMPPLRGALSFEEKIMESSKLRVALGRVKL